jgi:hypothetical protein
MCASRMEARPCPFRHGERPLRLSAFRLRIFFVRSFPFVIAGLDPAIHTEITLANASTGICCCSFAWTTGSMSGGDESESGVTVACHSPGAKSRRENEITYPPLEGEA